MSEYSLDDYRNAPSGEGPLAFVWHDKPHRLVYDLVKRSGDAERELAELTAQLEAAREFYAETDKQRRSLRSVCAEAYQFAGVVGAPVKVMDNLSAAANCSTIPHETFLPVTGTDCRVIRELTEQLEAVREWRGSK